MKWLEWLDTNKIVIMLLGITMLIALFIDTTLSKDIALALAGFVGGTVVTQAKE